MSNNVTDAYKGNHIDGDMSVSHDVHIGGDSITHGHAHFKSSVRIDGTLEADNINSTNKGLFSTEESLKNSYPNPKNGWWAIVGGSIPGIIYRVENRQWYNTGIMGGNINGDDDCAEFKEYVEDELTSIKKTVFPINLSLTHDLGSSLLEYTGKARTLMLKWSCSRQGKTFTPKSVVIAKIKEGTTPDVILNISNATTYSGWVEASVNKCGITKFQCTIVTQDGISMTTILEINQILPVFYGFTDSISSYSDMQKKLQKIINNTPIDISTTLSNGSNKNHLFICLPFPVTVKSVSSSGFDVPIDDAKVMLIHINNTSYEYNIYKSYNKIIPLNYEIQIITD